jgi:hypothetical protein
MQGNAVGSSQFRQSRRPNRIRFISPPGLANCGYMVDIDTKFRHGNSSIRGALIASIPSTRKLSRLHRFFIIKLKAPFANRDYNFTFFSGKL